MEKFDVLSFYGRENEELQKEYERMFCNMTKEEAIEMLRNNVCKSHHVYDNALPTIIEALETLIPELAENEDERVEKLITDSVFYQYGAGAEYKDVLDYLDRHNSEKQKEQKSTVKINGEQISTENQTVEVGDDETEVQKAYREGRNAGRKEVFDHPEYYGLQLRRMYDYETGRRNPEWSEEDKEQIEIFDADKFFAGKDVNDFKKELFLVIRGARELKPTDEEIWQNIESQIAPCLVDILQEGVESAEPKRKFKIGDVVTNGQDIYTIHLMGSDRYWLKEDDCVTIPFEYEDNWNKVEPKFKVGDKIKFSSEPKYPAREIVEIKDGAYYFDSAVHLPFTKQDEWELVEEKPARWSEEDEEMLNSCISSIEESKENRYAYRENDGDTSYDREIAWFKSLPERFNLQPKQEWNDEDESNAVFILESLDGLLRYCKKNKEGSQQSKQIKEAQEWIKTRLKSIEPQPETNDEEYIRNLENLESIVYYAKSLPDDTRTKLGNFLRSLRTRKTCGVDEFSLTLRNSLSTDSELTDEQADTFARAYGEDLYKVALGEISTGLDKWDLEEYRNEKFMGK